MTIVGAMLLWREIYDSIFVHDMLWAHSDADMEATCTRVTARIINWMRRGMPRPDTVYVYNELSEMNWTCKPWQFHGVELADGRWRVSRHSVPQNVMFLEVNLPDDMPNLLDWLATPKP